MTALLAIILAIAPAPDAKVDQAEAAWAAGDYETAAQRWAEAYEETGDIRHVFARGQALAKLDRCEEAIEVLEAFIATEPKEVAAQAARDTIETCRASLPEPEPEPEPEPVPPRVVETPPEPSTPPPPPPHWSRDPWAGAMLGVGTASVVAGATVALVARREQSRARGSEDLQTFARLDDRAVTLSRVSIPVMAVGGALVVGAIVRYVVVARRNRPPETAWYRGLGRF